MKYIVLLILLFIASPFVGVWAKVTILGHQCISYQEVTGSQTKFKTFQCYIKTTDGWKIQ